LQISAAAVVGCCANHADFAAASSPANAAKPVPDAALESAMPDCKATYGGFIPPVFCLQDYCLAGEGHGSCLLANQARSALDPLREQ